MSAATTLPLHDQISVSFAPLLPLPWLIGLGCVASLLIGITFYHRARGGVGRMIAFALLLAMFSNPVAEHALHQPVRDVAMLVVDDSASQDLPGRRAQIDRIVPSLRTQLKQLPDLEVREVHVTGRDSTALAAALVQATAEIPAERRAGAVLVTDGAIHDIDDNLKALQDIGPVHALLTGAPDEQDRRIVLQEVPHYGLVGQSVKIKLRVDDEPKNKGATTQIVLHILNGEDQVIEVTTGHDVTLDLPIDHAGDNIFTVAVPPLRGELTLANNRAVIRVQGIREKLRVLMVSGEPHPVERTWRNLLRADTAVELVHFTILRPPYKQDGTPTNEMALIGFPVQELFQDKLKSFDLIIFDRFRKQGMLPMPYFDNIAEYVENGGAFLDASGASYVTPQSLYQTPLARILPTIPLSKLRTQRFVPSITARGAQHPVTQKLGSVDHWGPWYHQTENKYLRGDILMEGQDHMPLLVLDHVGKGRVAQLHSDSMWLWAHGHEGGGPAAELLRRIAHWLMKEPELEEDQLQLEVTPAGDAYQLHITRPTAQPALDSVLVTAPDGSQQNYPLEQKTESASTQLMVKQVGAYTVTHQDKDQMVVVGDPNAPEMQHMLATDKILQPVLHASGGGSFWLADHPDGVTIQRTERGDRQSGRDWLGLRRNGLSLITGARAEELLPAWAWVLLIGTAIMLGWRREGK
jgi:hypothetical protein